MACILYRSKAHARELFREFPRSIGGTGRLGTMRPVAAFPAIAEHRA
jgi:hypothetical protein